MHGQGLYTVFSYNLMLPLLYFPGSCICAATLRHYCTNNEIALSRLPAKDNTSQSYYHPALNISTNDSKPTEILVNQIRPLGHATSFDVLLPPRSLTGTSALYRR
jgi:hypothetical protein